MAQPVPAGSRPARVIAVLGMHRSGTSAVTGSLEQHGLFLGEVSTEDRHNPRGNREARAMRLLNEGILRANGGAWDNPPARVAWQPEHEEQAREFLAEHAGRELWGFKDPRTLLTLGGWRELVPDLERVGVFRHPLRVARSLARRNEMSTDAAVALWQAYNEPLVAELRREPFPLICFDDEPAVLQAKLRVAAQALDLPGVPTGEGFFAAELRDADAVGDPPPRARPLYEELRKLSL
jgi:hypothetical protein